MKLINLFGGPGSGKSTAAAIIFSELKREHIATELVGEFAKELIYLGNEVQLVNQVYMMGSQYRKQKDLERCGIEVAVSDSPLRLQLCYCNDKPYFEELRALITKLDSEFENINIFVDRAAPYQVYGRMQTEAEADSISKKIKKELDGYFHFYIRGTGDEALRLTKHLLPQLKK